MKHRRLVQFLFLVLLNFSWGPEFKWLCMPVLNCHSCALAWFACPVGVLVHFAGWHVFPLVALGTILLLGVTVGRLLCGWICPFGLLQDLLYKIPLPKLRMPYWTSFIKYAVLAAMVIALPFALGADTWYSFCRVCPASALQVTLPNIVRSGWPQQHGIATAARLTILAGVIALVIVNSRGFCRMLCPIGAVLAPLNYISLWAIRTPAENCMMCGKCDGVCPVEGTPSARMGNGGSPNREQNCIVCHECQKACPQRSS